MKDETKNELQKIVRQNYNDIADDFSATRYAVWPELRTVIARSVALNLSEAYGSGRATWQSREDKYVPITVLDLGCGNGRLLEIFYHVKSHSAGISPKEKLFNKVNYTGIEQSDKLANHAREYIKKNNIKNAEIITGDILNLDKLLNEQFDLILLIAVLPHIPSHELRVQFLKNIKTKLKPDGSLIISIWNLRVKPGFKIKIFKYTFLKLLRINKMELGDIIFPWKDNNGRAVSLRYYHVFSVKSLQKLLGDAGFNIKKIYSDQHNIYAICTH